MRICNERMATNEWKIETETKIIVIVAGNCSGNQSAATRSNNENDVKRQIWIQQEISGEKHKERSETEEEEEEKENTQ